MKKLLRSSILILTAQNSFASDNLSKLVFLNLDEATIQSQSSNAEVTPVAPISCANQDYKYANKIIGIELQENATQFIINFKTTVGGCEAGLLSATDIRNSSVKIIGEKYYSVFGAYPADAEIRTGDQYSQIGLVKLTFDKTQIFANTKEANFEYSLTTPVGIVYKWNLNLTQISESKTAFRFL